MDLSFSQALKESWRLYSREERTSFRMKVVGEIIVFLVNKTRNVYVAFRNMIAAGFFNDCSADQKGLTEMWLRFHLDPPLRGANQIHCSTSTAISKVPPLWRQMTRKTSRHKVRHHNKKPAAPRIAVWRQNLPTWRLHSRSHWSHWSTPFCALNMVSGSRSLL